jgi:hypothetical protein
MGVVEDLIAKYYPEHNAINDEPGREEGFYHCEDCARWIQNRFYDALKEAVESKWIDTEKRLPEDSGYYLTAGRGTKMCVSQFGNFSFSGLRSPIQDAQGRTFPANVTHWMPLPEPPKYH